MSLPQFAFAGSVPLSARPFVQLRLACDFPPTPRNPVVSTRSTRMQTSANDDDKKIVKPPENPTWPPPEMTDEWADAVQRLANAASLKSPQPADIALQEADGDEREALRLLMDQNWSDTRRKREEAVARARAAGDVNRVSAMKEAEMRRIATGSARDFFKGYVENEGTYVDDGYVDDGADAMGKLASKFKKWFGGK